MFDTWHAIERSLLFEVQICKIRTTQLRGMLALAILRDPRTPAAERRRFAREVTKAVAKLHATSAHWAIAFSGLLRASLADATGDRDAAHAELERSIAQLDAIDMALYAACARRFRGRLVGGEQGDAEIAAQDAWMQARGIASPAKLAALLVPGSLSGD
jgi:hypothetical protein